MALSDKYRDDGVSFRKLTDEQNAIKEDIKRAMNAGEYDLVENKCLCGSGKSLVLAEKDCFGIPQRVVLCPECSLIYQNPILTEKALIGLYESKFRILYGHHYAKEEYFANQQASGRRIAGTMARYMDLKGKRVLDIGCGTGGVLMPFRDKGAEVFGIDIDDEYLSMGKSKGLELVKVDFMNFNPGKKFDLIIMTDTFEHLPNANEILHRINGMLSDGGYLYIGVPNIDPFTSKFHFLYHLHVLHMWYFDRNTLGDLLGSHGFEVADICTDRNLEVISRKSVPVAPGARRKRGIEAMLKYAVLKLRCTREAVVSRIRQVSKRMGGKG